MKSSASHFTKALKTLSLNYNDAQLALQQRTTETTIPGTPASEHSAKANAWSCDSTHFLYSQSIKHATCLYWNTLINIVLKIQRRMKRDTVGNDVWNRGEGLIWRRVVMLFSKFLYLNTQTQRLLWHHWGLWTPLADSSKRDFQTSSVCFFFFNQDHWNQSTHQSLFVCYFPLLNI